MHNKIKETDYFKNTNPIRQKVLLRKETVRAIELGVNMSKLKSFDFWVQTTNPVKEVKLVVSEILK